MSASPVTLMVARRVANSRYQDFNRWLNEGRELAADFPGYLGSGVLAPPKEDDEYQIIFRFDSQETLSAWEHSASRHAWLERGKGLYDAPHEHRATGLDAWFKVSPGATPPRWKQAVAVWLAFFPISLLFQWTFGSVLAEWPLNSAGADEYHDADSRYGVCVYPAFNTFTSAVVTRKVVAHGSFCPLSTAA